MDVTEVRRRRVRQLIDEQYGGKDAEFARETGIAPTQVARWFMTSAHRRNIGERLARRIEDKCGLAPSWLDIESGDVVSGPTRVAMDFDARTRDKLLDLFNGLKPSQRKFFLQEMEKVVEDNRETVLHLAEKLGGKKDARGKVKAAAT